MNHNSNRDPATRDSWNALPMPERREKLDIEFAISQRQYQSKRYGYIPEAMEDKWFYFMEDDWLYIHRSWTGYCIYQVKIVGDANSGYRVAEVWVNRDEAQYKGYLGQDLNWLKAFFGIRED